MPARFSLSAGAAGAPQIGQDDWLTRCDEDGYPCCREWASAIRRWAPDAEGLTWLSKRDPGQRVVMLRGDPAGAVAGCGLVVGTADPFEPLERGAGRIRLDAFLTRWRLYLEP